MQANSKAQAYLDTALDALSASDVRHEVLNRLPVPVYTTDADGAVTYWNKACVEFAGRMPQLGEDKWCVTWRLYTTSGDHVPHDQCPMAQAIRQKRPIRDAIAIAERPDGTRRAFKPYPTPLFDQHGVLTGAVNVLIDVSGEQSEALTEQAERCRRLAGATYDRETCSVLGAMADGFEGTAKKLKR